MCTLSWLLRPGGHEIHFNRDELRSRAIAEPPRIEVLGGRRVIAPRDGEAGGTWISTNDAGTSLCLLNRYQDGGDGAPEAPTSRGALVLALAPLGGQSAVDAALGAADLSVFRGFDLVVFDEEATPVHHSWDGDSLQRTPLGPADRPMSSSSLFPDGAAAARRRALMDAATETGEVDGEILGALHRSHRPERGPLSVCMHREEAQTVSYARICVDASTVRFDYVEGPPCEAKGGLTRSLSVGR